MTDTVKEKTTRTAYLLWLVSIFGWLGFHRFYLNRPLTGLLWIFTLGIYGVGCLADLFLIPGMVETENQKVLSMPDVDDQDSLESALQDAIDEDASEYEDDDLDSDTDIQALLAATEGLGDCPQCGGFMTAQSAGKRGLKAVGRGFGAYARWEAGAMGMRSIVGSKGGIFDSLTGDASYICTDCGFKV